LIVFVPILKDVEIRNRWKNKSVEGRMVLATAVQMFRFTAWRGQ
jgi:hypothetical protein